MINLGYGDITVVHSKGISCITKSKKKIDKADSLKLTNLHLFGMIPESHLLDEEERIREMILIQAGASLRENQKERSYMPSWA